MTGRGVEYNKLIRELSDDPLRQAQLVMLEILKVIDQICEKHKLQYWIDAGTLLGAVRHKGFIPWDDDIDVCLARKDYNKFIEVAKRELPKDLFLQTRDTDKSIWKWIKVRDNYSTFIQTTELDQKVSYHQGIFVDIFPYDIIEKQFSKSKLLLNRRWHKSTSKLVRFFSGVLNGLSILPIKIIGYKNLKKFIINMHTGKEANIVSTGVDITVGFQNFKYNTVFPCKKIEFEGLQFNAPNDYKSYLTQMYGDFMKLPPKEDRIVHAHEIFPFTKCNHPQSIQY
ncbi:LicD family protein [Saccharicrinis aurantiacus]|uniref:LicD family protein n=1 Tax=Saccharicrinis aurantiacus TaxID=1849719 RepID=UPI002493BA73|nr:LicD family protein [Saccharicrinis aurantiacus]